MILGQDTEPECDVPVPGVFHFFGGIGTYWYWEKVRYRKIWYLEKVSGPVSEKFGSGTDFRPKTLGILKIHNRYRYRIGTGTKIFSFFLVASEPVSEKNWYCKKSRNRYRYNLVPKKVLVSVSKIFCTGKKYRYRYFFFFNWGVFQNHLTYRGAISREKQEEYT